MVGFSSKIMKLAILSLLAALSSNVCAMNQGSEQERNDEAKEQFQPGMVTYDLLKKCLLAHVYGLKCNFSATAKDNYIYYDLKELYGFSDILFPEKEVYDGRLVCESKVESNRISSWRVSNCRARLTKHENDMLTKDVENSLLEYERSRCTDLEKNFRKSALKLKVNSSCYSKMFSKIISLHTTLDVSRIDHISKQHPKGYEKIAHKIRTSNKNMLSTRTTCNIAPFSMRCTTANITVEELEKLAQNTDDQESFADTLLAIMTDDGVKTKETQQSKSIITTEYCVPY